MEIESVLNNDKSYSKRILNIIKQLKQTTFFAGLRLFSRLDANKPKAVYYYEPISGISVYLSD